MATLDERISEAKERELLEAVAQAGRDHTDHVFCICTERMKHAIRALDAYRAEQSAATQAAAMDAKVERLAADAFNTAWGTEHGLDWEKSADHETKRAFRHIGRRILSFYEDAAERMTKP